MVTRALMVITISVIALFVPACGWLSTRHYNVDRASPNGTYRVKVNVRLKDEGDFLGHFTEQGNIKVLKGQEAVYEREWGFRDNWEDNFIDSNPKIEWVGDNILRMGRDNSSQPFTNELIISNNTDERLKHIGVSCGKFEHFDVFDVAPRAQVMLRPSPGLNYYASGDVSLGYGGETESGKGFTGVVQEKQPNSSLRLQITVSAQDLP